MTAQAPNALSRKILVVDDDARAGHALGRMLEGDGFDVVVCASAAEALEMLEREPFDTVVTDLELVGHSGLDLLRRTREKWHEMRLFVLTASQRWQNESRLTALGVNEQFTKPLDYGALLSCLLGTPAI